MGALLSSLNLHNSEKQSGRETEEYRHYLICLRTQGQRQVTCTAKANATVPATREGDGVGGKMSRIRSVEAERGRVTVRLTNTVALAALRSRRYLSRYFSFWLFFGSFFILALPDCSGVRGEEAGPPSRLMVRPRYGAFGARPASAPMRRSAGFVLYGPPGSGLLGIYPSRTFARRTAAPEVRQPTSARDLPALPRLSRK